MRVKALKSVLLSSHPITGTKKPPLTVAYDIAYCLFLFGFKDGARGGT